MAIYTPPYYGTWPVIDDAIYQRRRRLHGCIRARMWDYSVNIHWHKLIKRLLTAMNRVEIYCQKRHLLQTVVSFLSFTFHKVMWRNVWGVVVSLISNVLQNYCWVRWWKNFEKPINIWRRWAALLFTILFYSRLIQCHSKNTHCYRL